MKIIIKLFAMLMLIAGISLLIKPEIIFVWIKDNMENTSLYISAIVVRLVFGILFVIAAKESKYAGAIKFFGYVFIAAAIIFIFMGQERFQYIITTLIPEVKHYAPVSGLLSMVFGSFLIYAFSRKKELR